MRQSISLIGPTYCILLASLFPINASRLNIRPRVDFIKIWHSSLHLLITLLGATYDSIEGRFRIIKREAAILRSEIEQGERPEAPPRGASSTKSGAAGSEAASFASSSGLPGSTPRKPRTPRKPKVKAEFDDHVLTGRVGKNNATPAKKANAAIEVKTEPLNFEDSSVDIGQEVVDLGHESFMEALEKTNFDDVLHYEGGMEI